MLVAASRLEDELMPSSDRLFWISLWPAPLKLRPISLFGAAMTPGVLLARLQTLRPFRGSSLTARWPIVSEIFALSVSRIGDEATTVIDSFNWPTFTTTLVRTTWLLATSTPLTLDVWKPVSVTVI